MGIIFKAPAFLMYFVAGLWGLYLCFNIVESVFGGFIAILSVFIFPVLLTIAPIYQGIANNDWFPLLLIYGSGIGATTLYMQGSWLDGDLE